MIDLPVSGLLCPVCYGPIDVVTIEPHPSRRDEAIKNYQCVKCGVVKASAISLRPDKESHT